MPGLEQAGGSVNQERLVGDAHSAGVVPLPTAVETPLYGFNPDPSTGRTAAGYTEADIRHLLGTAVDEHLHPLGKAA